MKGTRRRRPRGVSAPVAARQSARAVVRQKLREELEWAEAYVAELRRVMATQAESKQ